MVAHARNGVLLTREKERTTDACIAWKSIKCIPVLGWSGYMQCDSVYMTFWKRLGVQGGPDYNRVLFRVNEWFFILSMVVIHMTCVCQNL